jgi:hypothetical protein
MLILLMGYIYDMSRWDGFTWHHIGAKCHEDLYNGSRNIKICHINLNRSNVVLLIYELGIMKCVVEMGSAGMTYMRTKFHDDRGRHLSNTTVIAAII